MASEKGEAGTFGPGWIGAFTGGPHRPCVGRLGAPRQRASEGLLRSRWGCSRHLLWDSLRIAKNGSKESSCSDALRKSSTATSRRRRASATSVKSTRRSTAPSRHPEALFSSTRRTFWPLSRRSCSLQTPDLGLRRPHCRRRLHRPAERAWYI